MRFTLRDIWPTTEGEHPLADLFAICLAEGHEWVWFNDVWLKCERCGSQTPGNREEDE